MGRRQDEYFLRFDDRLRINKEDWESCVRSSPGGQTVRPGCHGKFHQQKGQFWPIKYRDVIKDVYYKDTKY